MPGLLAANRLRYDILKLPTPERRVDQLCRLYAGWTLDNTEELEWWAARWIRREARTGQRDLIFDVFRRIVAEVDADKMPREEKDLYRVRCFRAIVFLGDSLTPQEKRTMDKADQNQVDILYREP